MSTPQSDGLKAEIDQGRMRVGNQVQSSDGNPTTNASVPMYVDANKNLAAGLPMLMASSSTSASFLDITGYATLSADEIMHGPLVAGAGVTTWTKTGYIQVTITDSAGNITNGKHYIQFGTLT